MSPRWEPDPGIRRGNHVVCNLHAHLVFVTKYRREVFDDDMLTRCEAIMRDVCEKSEAELREFNGEGGHVHPLVHYPPEVALSKLVNSLKGVSSRYLRAEYTGRINRIGMDSVFWAPPYFVGSCGGPPLSIVREYIENQKRPT
ncbi:IS200/IS605 family transposase [Streptomyces sp. NBC_00233]|uniref:IS200/IS605 family transposase n=1 Tax=Streptomyces sp. NBC_00233 TaxID=2975686 RepID=UPI00224EABEC|nr:IS200/IS605 family transposase [Streptomyces sp. NBC_00233]MCX5233485.1 IS200/IS605 family transposase [Streptomyces sp. NBC_00233]